MFHNDRRGLHADNEVSSTKNETTTQKKGGKLFPVIGCAAIVALVAYPRKARAKLTPATARTPERQHEWPNHDFHEIAEGGTEYLTPTLVAER